MMGREIILPSLFLRFYLCQRKLYTEIATVLVNAAFIIALAAIAVAFAISFGIGGRDFAKKQLGDLDVAIDQLKADSKAAMEAKEKEGAKKETAKENAE